MKKLLLQAAAVMLLMTSCKNNADEKKGDAEQAGHEMMHDTMQDGAGVPPIPAVPEGARVYFANLENGAQISSPYTIQMGAENIRVDSAGPVRDGSGHHHLFINAEDSLATGEIIGKDDQHIHFGNGQTSYELSLPPGKHKLTLQMADGLHRSYGSKLSATIEVTVK